MNYTLFVEQVKFRFSRPWPWRPEWVYSGPSAGAIHWHWNEENCMNDDDADFDLRVVRDGD